MYTIFWLYINLYILDKMYRFIYINLYIVYIYINLYISNRMYRFIYINVYNVYIYVYKSIHFYKNV